MFGHAGVSAAANGGPLRPDEEPFQEIAIMRSLCHPNIVRLIEVIGARGALAAAEVALVQRLSCA